MHGQAAEGQAEQPHEVRTAASSSDSSTGQRVGRYSSQGDYAT